MLPDSTPDTIPDPRRWKALALLCTAFFMVILDSSIVLVALPSIETDLDFSAGDLQWVLSAYLLSFGGLLLLGGRAADLVGRRRMFMIGAAVFGAASLICGLAWSDLALIAARAAQGVGAAIVTPTALSILMTTFEEGPERNKALGFWTAMAALGGTAGWVIGGPIVEGLGWQWIFFINLPVATGLVALSPLLLRESQEQGRERAFDAAGAVTITAGLVALVYAVVKAPDVGWIDAQTLGLSALSGALIAAFAGIEMRSPDPLVPLGVLRSRILVGGNLVLFFLGMLAYGPPFILTQYGQQILGFSPLEFGLAYAVMPIGVVGASAAGQALATMRGVRPVAAASMVFGGLSCLSFTQVSVDGSYLGDMFIGLLLLGPAVGLGYVAGSIASLEGVAETDAGLASGLNNTSFQIGAAVGVAILSTVAVSEANGSQALTALTNGFQAAFATAIGFAVLGLVVVLMLLRKQRDLDAVGEPVTAPPD
jgi:EmrB/QacA subfamily drug resistance transporter